MTTTPFGGSYLGRGLGRLGDVDHQLAGHLVRVPDGHDAGFELALAERLARVGLGQTGQLEGERQQRHELLHLRLLTVDVGGHGGPFPRAAGCRKIRCIVPPAGSGVKRSEDGTWVAALASRAYSASWRSRPRPGRPGSPHREEPWPTRMSSRPTTATLRSSSTARRRHCTRPT